MPKYKLQLVRNYSPNFGQRKRKVNDIKFIIFHYTGMKNESHATKRLVDSKSKVSSHYLIRNDGKILVLVPDLYIAWHAGVSSWKKYKFLNKNSIGIEISNPGHNFYYKKFSSKQVASIIVLSKLLIKKYNIKSENILGHSDIAPDRKKDPGEKFPWKYLALNKIGFWHQLKEKKLKIHRNKKISKNEEKEFFACLLKFGYFLKLKSKSKNKLLIKSFQRHFRQQLIDGKIDKECLIIAKKLLK